MNRGSLKKGPPGPTSNRPSVGPPDSAGKRVKQVAPPPTRGHMERGLSLLTKNDNVSRQAKRQRNPRQQLSGIFGGGVGAWLRVLHMDIGTAILWLALATASLGQRMFKQLNSLRKRVKRLEKQRSGPNLVMIIGLLALGLCYGEMLRYLSDGKGALRLEREDGSIVDVAFYKLPSDACPGGTVIEKHCPLVIRMSDLENIDCGSSVEGFHLRYHRCVPQVRRRRAPQPQVSNQVGLLEEVEMIGFRFFRENVPVIVVCLLVAAVAMRWPMWSVVLISVLTWNVVKASSIEPLYTISATGTSLTHARLLSNEIYSISTERGLIHLDIHNVTVRGERPFKTLLTKCDVVESFSEDTCPGGSHLDMARIRRHNRTCKVDSFNRGWGTGCFEWGLGQVATCVEVSCASHTNVSVLVDSIIQAKVSMEIHGHQDTQSIVRDVPTQFQFGDVGTITLTCGVTTDRIAGHYYHIREGVKAGLVLREAVDSWPGMIKMGGFTSGMDKIVRWGITTANEIKIDGLINPQIDWQTSVLRDIRSISFTCEMIFDNISFSSLPLCAANASGTFIQNGYGQDGVVAVSLEEVMEQACSFPLKCKGCTLTCPSLVIAEKSQVGRAHVICGNGTSHVEFGTTVVPVECLVTPVTQAWRLLSHVTGRYTKTGVTGLGSVWEDLLGNLRFSWSWFPSSWLVMAFIGLALFLVFGRVGSFVVFVVIIAVYVRSVSADVGCGVDTTRKTISCGSGAFVWKQLGLGATKDHAVELDDYEFTDLYIKDMFDGTNKPCLICEDSLQCAALRSAAYSAAFRMSPALVSVNDTLSRTRQFIETRKRTMTVTLNLVEYKIGSYVTHGRLEGDMGLLPTLFGSFPEKPSDKVIRIVASRPDIRRLCGKAVSFQFQYTGFRRALYGSNVQVKVSKNITNHCPTYLAGVVVKNGRTIITDGMFWMESENRDGVKQIVSLEMTQSHRCVWPEEYTPETLQDPRDMNIFIPPAWGGPISKVNHIPGYKMQTDFPWNASDITLVEGPVPGTEVKVDARCNGRMRAKVVDPKGNGSWCCQSCNRIVHFKVGDQLVYPMEIQLGTMPEIPKPKPKIVEEPIGDEYDPEVDDILHNYGKAHACSDFSLVELTDRSWVRQVHSESPVSRGVSSVDRSENTGFYTDAPGSHHPSHAHIWNAQHIFICGAFCLGLVGSIIIFAAARRPHESVDHSTNRELSSTPAGVHDPEENVHRARDSTHGSPSVCAFPLLSGRSASENTLWLARTVSGSDSNRGLQRNISDTPTGSLGILPRDGLEDVPGHSHRCVSDVQFARMLQVRREISQHEKRVQGLWGEFVVLDCLLRERWGDLGRGKSAATNNSSDSSLYHDSSVSVHGPVQREYES
ncbi:truncated polyprotein [Kamiti River virus]|uniref:truncated polyprotein n=2 Tax=Kamiti River virus TaxID=218849 RepID=UPI000269ADAD|nr:truncated polyprotein [Kamiti River virus]